MVARIFKPSKSAMQSGRGKTNDWVLEHPLDGPRIKDPLMGYNSSSDMENQVRLTFETLEEAEKYCQRNDLAYAVVKPKERKVKRVAYADNFKYGRLTPWTH